MPVQGGLRKDTLEHGDERNQRTLLRPVECVGWAATPVKAPDIADTDAVLIVTIGMGTNNLYRTTHMDGAINVNDIMITNVIKASLKMPLTYFIHRVMFVLTSGRTMNDDIVNLTHACCII